MNSTVTAMKASKSSPMLRFLAFYQVFDQSSVTQLRSYYHREVEFCDPLHRIQGLDRLERYFLGLSSQLLHCEFDFGEPLISGHRLAIEWTMHYQHKRLQSGRRLSLRGASHIEFLGEKVIRHQDYFDAGAMVYEHVPVLGRAIRWVKRRVQGPVALANEAPDAADACVTEKDAAMTPTSETLFEDKLCEDKLCEDKLCEDKLSEASTSSSLKSSSLKTLSKD